METRLASATSSQNKTLPQEGPHCRPRRTFPWARSRTQVSEPSTQNSRPRSAPFGQSQFGGCRIRSPGLSSARCRRPGRSTHLAKAAPRTGLAGRRERLRQRQGQPRAPEVPRPWRRWWWPSAGWSGASGRGHGPGHVGHGARRMLREVGWGRGRCTRSGCLCECPYGVAVAGLCCNVSAWACPRRTGYQKTSVLGRRGPAFSRGAPFSDN